MYHGSDPGLYYERRVGTRIRAILLARVFVDLYEPGVGFRGGKR